MSNVRDAGLLIKTWLRLPVVLRAVLAAFFVFIVGSIVTALPLLGNLRFLPGIPWALPATLVLLWAYWRWSSGLWPPRSTQMARHEVTRKKQLSRRIWIVVLPVMAVQIIAIISLRLILPSLLPVSAPSVSIDLSPYPTVTVIGMLLSIAAIAAVTEEVSIRGYLQQPLENKYGVLTAILFSGLAWWLLHTDKVTWTHLPFHLFASLLIGYTAWITGSLLPGMLAHFLGDAILQPAYLFRAPDFVWQALNAKPLWSDAAPASYTLVIALSGILIVSTALSVLGLIHLSRIKRAQDQ